MGVIVHVVDNGDKGMEGKRFDRDHTKTKGEIVIRISPMCDGNTQIINDIVSTVGDKKIDGLYFHGHGAPGIQNVGGGSSDGSKQGSALTLDSLDDSSWRSVRNLLGDDAHVMMKGCNTGAGEMGDDLLAKMSKTFGAPVTAAETYQVVGTSEFIGQTKTGRPSGKVNSDKDSKIENQKNYDSLPLWLKAALEFKNNFDKPDDNRKIGSPGSEDAGLP